MLVVIMINISKTKGSHGNLGTNRMNKNLGQWKKQPKTGKPKSKLEKKELTEQYHKTYQRITNQDNANKRSKSQC